MRDLEKRNKYMEIKAIFALPYDEPFSAPLYKRKLERCSHEDGNKSKKNSLARVIFVGSVITRGLDLTRRDANNKGKLPIAGC